MTEPRIQYARTSDGVSIAYCAFGDGPPLVHMPAIPFSHLQMERQVPDWRNWQDELAARFTLVRYDARGTGMSDREVIDFSLESMEKDLEAVVDALGLERFVIWAPYSSGPWRSHTRLAARTGSRR